MDWYTMESMVKMNQREVEHKSLEFWKFKGFRPSKHVNRSEVEMEGLYGRAFHVLQEMLNSDNAELRLQAAEIVMKHSLKNKRKPRLLG